MKRRFILLCLLTALVATPTYPGGFLARLSLPKKIALGTIAAAITAGAAYLFTRMYPTPPPVVVPTFQVPPAQEVVLRGFIKRTAQPYIVITRSARPYSVTPTPSAHTVRNVWDHNFNVYSANAKDGAFKQEAQTIPQKSFIEHYQQDSSSINIFTDQGEYVLPIGHGGSIFSPWCQAEGQQGRMIERRDYSVPIQQYPQPILDFSRANTHQGRGLENNTRLIGVQL